MSVKDEFRAIMAQGDFAPGSEPLIVTEEKIRKLIEDVRPLAAPDIKCLFVGGEDTPFVGEFDGLDGFAEAWSDWLSAFESLELDLGDVLVDNDDCVVIDGRQRGESVTAGVEVAGDAVAVWRFDDEHLTHAEFYLERETALRAAGL